MSNLPRVSIVVPFYNQEHVVEQSVRNLLSQDYPTELINFIFIDDGSTDRTAEILDRYNSDPRVNVITFSENRGRSTSRNAGITASDSQLIGFLDGDMTVEPDWLRLLVGLLNDEVVGAMGDSRLPVGTKPNRLDRYFYSYYRGARQIGENYPLHFRWFLFNNALIKKDALDKIGYFDQSFTTYGGEDTDLAIRLWQAFPKGLRFSTRAVSYHHHRRTVATFCHAMKGYGRENLPRLLKRYPDYACEMAGNWIWSLKGKLVFNFVIRGLVKFLFTINPRPLFVRYLVVDSVISGARQAGPVL